MLYKQRLVSFPDHNTRSSTADHWLVDGPVGCDYWLLGGTKFCLIRVPAQESSVFFEEFATWRFFCLQMYGHHDQSLNPCCACARRVKTGIYFIVDSLTSTALLHRENTRGGPRGPAATKLNWRFGILLYPLVTTASFSAYLSTTFF